MATPTITGANLPEPAPPDGPAGELIVVVGPENEKRAELLLALGQASWATGPAITIDAAPSAATWVDLRRAADSGATVIAACECTADAGPYAHRMVLLPHPDGEYDSRH